MIIPVERNHYQWVHKDPTKDQSSLANCSCLYYFDHYSLFFDWDVPRQSYRQSQSQLAVTCPLLQKRQGKVIERWWQVLCNQHLALSILIVNLIIKSFVTGIQKNLDWFYHHLNLRCLNNYWPGNKVLSRYKLITCQKSYKSASSLTWYNKLITCQKSRLKPSEVKVKQKIT